MVLLGVNVDHVATLREVRKACYPSVLEAALLAEKAGASQITIHLREDRRHIQDRDLFLLKKNIKTRLNLEMAISKEIVDIAIKSRPWQVTIVPEKRRELTTEGGLNFNLRRKALGSGISRLKKAKMLVSLFISPNVNDLKSSFDLNADAVEINTGLYSEAKTKKVRLYELRKIEKVTNQAVKLGIITHAGHGLTLDNVKDIARINGIKELNIGHSIVARSIIVGFEAAVREMIEAISI